MQPITSFYSTDLSNALNTLKTTSGMFSRIQDSFGTLICYDTDDNVVLQFDVSNETMWSVTPYLNDTTPVPDGNHQLTNATFNEGYLCAQGLYLITVSMSSQRHHLIITKGSNGKCCTIIVTEQTNFGITSQSVMYVTAKGDDTSLPIYTGGIKSPGYFALAATVIADRTILEKIPIVGVRGSNDYVSGCFTIFMRQFQDPGNVIIDGKKYYCANRFAIIDE